MSLDGAAAAYDRLLAWIGERAADIGARPVVSQWSHRGSDGRRLLIVGQAVAGWPDDWRAADATTATGRSRILAMMRARNAGRAEPMDWIMDIDRPYGTEDIVASAIAPLFENPREPRVCHSTVG